ncbi:hypothetical protein [uncultured Mailhella sp.]|uniref:hypothetical protein n=1 Tax=uncultured Mailhella sp. TaxID=1981031 RepID=UPI0025DECABD|nr:hypothetical protein [uncultured Mailhella sp.]
MDKKALLAGLLRLAQALLEAWREARGRDVRRRARDDGAGLLLSQLRGGDSAPAGTDQPSEAGAERQGGAVDEQR